jgi:uncharacterized integral membrane protein
MPWRLLLNFLYIFLLLFFIGINFTFTSSVDFWFFKLNDVPTVLLLIGSFITGAIFMYPFLIFRGKKKITERDIRKHEKKQVKEQEKSEKKYQKLSAPTDQKSSSKTKNSAHKDDSHLENSESSIAEGKPAQSGTKAKKKGSKSKSSPNASSSQIFPGMIEDEENDAASKKKIPGKKAKKGFFSRFLPK